jgi:nicotinamidase/pyrazinamidase
MPRHALIVVDMIRAYLEPAGPLACEAAHAIVPTIAALAEQVRVSGGLVVFANTALSSPDDPIARRWGMHARRGTTECEVWPELGRAPQDLVVEKTSYNAFFRNDLDALLRAAGVETVAIAGIHTHVCVLLTAAAAADLGYDVITIQDAVTTDRRENHDSRLRFFASHVGELIGSAEYIARLSGEAPPRSP